MAKKMNASGHAQNASGNPALATRQPTPQATPPYLMQHLPRLGGNIPPKRRLQITVDDTTYVQIPQSVKITHIG
jgi:hypothetical protein